jgi:hypothetical protein
MRVQNIGGQIVLSLTPREASKAGIVTNVVAAQAPSAPAERTYATKAEREMGLGFACSCGRIDLRVMPVAGRSFHKDPSGNLHDLR